MPRVRKDDTDDITAVTMAGWWHYQAVTMLRAASAAAQRSGPAHKHPDITLLDSRDPRHQQLLTAHCAAVRERRWAAGENIVTRLLLPWQQLLHDTWHTWHKYPQFMTHCHNHTRAPGQDNPPPCTNHWSCLGHNVRLGHLLSNYPYHIPNS